MRLPLVIFITTSITLLIIEKFAPFPILIATRLYGEVAGIFEILAISAYCSFLGNKMLISSDRARWRRITWAVFSVIFFGQLFLGMLGYTQFLQTGNLHYPLPALIISGPIYRMDGVFMLGLYLTTLILSGPSWCSHLCYIGAIDNWFAKGKNKIQSLNSGIKSIRFFILFLSIIIPLIFVLLNLPSVVANSIVISFLAITILSFYISYKIKISFYCSCICPIGVLSNLLGRINILRLKIHDNCDLCGVCANICNYSAIDKHKNKMQINYRCTLCMDCTTTCHNRCINLSLWGSKKLINDEIFYGIVLTLHGVFIACARI